MALVHRIIIVLGVHVSEVGMEMVAEGLPVVPLSAGFGGSCSRDAMVHVFLCRQEVMNDVSMGGTVQRRQG